jgi:hypothetical protein
MSVANKIKVIECLRELANYDYQRKVWLASSGPEVSSFTEAVCGLFDDSGLGKALDKPHNVFTNEIDALLRELRMAIRKIDGLRKPLIVIADPEMDHVRRLAERILLLIDRTK